MASGNAPAAPPQTPESTSGNTTQPPSGPIQRFSAFAAGLSSRRLTFGRLQIYMDPQDWWIGLYRPDDRHAIYVCPLPLLVFRWERP
jgi:hypothetical protein